MTTGAGGELHSALLRWIVSRASGVYSEHARVGRIASTLSRDTTQYCHLSDSNGQTLYEKMVEKKFLLEDGREE